MRITRILVSTAIACVLCATAARAYQGPADWFEIQRRLTTRLETQDVGELARALAADDTSSDEALVERLIVFVRADHGARALASIEALTGVDEQLLGSACTWLIGRKRDVLARRLLELRPDLRAGWTYVLLRRMVEADGVDPTLAWVRERERSAPDVWLRERARILKKHGGTGPLCDELEKAIRAAPHDLEAILRYLDITRDNAPKRDVEWIGPVALTPGALDDLLLARALAHRAPRASQIVLKRCLARELDDEGRARMSGLFHIPGGADLQVLLRSNARRLLLDALIDAGDTDDAQALMEQLAEENADGQGSVPWSGWLALAGQVQQASGQRAIENKVLADEQLGEDDPRYWIGRSAYYRGRTELEEALAAARKAVALAPLDGPWMPRWNGIEAVRRLLHQMEGEQASITYLREELARAEPQGGFPPRAARVNAVARRIVGVLVTDFPGSIAADDERLWRYLESVPALDHNTARLLQRMVESALAGDQLDDGFWDRITAIVRAGAPSGRQRLASVMIVSGSGERAIRFLRESLDVVSDEDRPRCAFYIVRAGLESGDWRVAREAWPIGRQDLGPDERGERLARMARLAAMDGEPDVALRLWQRGANYDRGVMDGVLELCAAPGMAARLSAWYAELAEREPDSDARTRFLAALAD
ncbi:MAG: hypothetical protein GY711_20905 [bacterium]|nr:hypothetical protein [bacterium]